MGPSFLRIYSLLVTVSITNGQISISGCPENWDSYENSCYMFIADDIRIAAEADAACWVHGARLVSVNDLKEHQYIQDWLFRHDLFRENIWHTSGVYLDGVLIWQGDNTVYQGPFYWNNPTVISTEDTDYRIAYDFGETTGTFGWGTESGTLPAHYICELPKFEISQETFHHRRFDYGIGSKDPEQIRRGPKLFQQPENIVLVAESELIDSVFIECIAAGNPLPTYHWFRGDNFSEAVNSDSDNRYTLSSGRLTIENPDNNKDFNDYRCVAENEYGSVVSETAQLLFGYLHDFSPIKPEDVTAQQFDGVKLDCQEPAAVPGVRYEWFEYSANAFIYPDHEYKFISNSGSLYFSEVQLTDAKEYFCIVTLTAPVNFKMATHQPPSKTSLGLWLHVTGYRVGEFGPIIHTHVFPSPVLRGSTVRMECIAYGTLHLYYSWRRSDGRPFPKGTTLSDLNRVLTIPNVQFEDQGNYECVCMRREMSASKVITLVLEARPYFPFPIQDMLVDPGTRVKWRCAAVAVPPATYSWYKNGKPVEIIAGQIEVIWNYLFIQSVNKERDEGMYQCSATNIHGTVYSTGQLKVFSFKPNFNKNPLPPSTLAPLGGYIIIECSVEGAPEPEVKWQKNGADLDLVHGDINGHLEMSLNHDLLIKDVTAADEGMYTCRASNSLGEASNSTYVTVVDDIRITQGPSDQEVVTNNTAFLYCQASYDYARFDLVYIWSFNGIPIDFNLHEKHYVKSQQNGINGLYIRKAQYKHMGEYTCTAKTTLQTDSRTAYLTVLGPPGEPAGVYVDPLTITATSAKIIWTIGPDHGADVNLYTIEAESEYVPEQWNTAVTDIAEADVVRSGSDDAILRSDQRRYVVRGLMPNTGYSFRVRAINLYGFGEPSFGSDFIQTPATAPVIAPRNVTGGGGSVGMLTIKWEPLKVSEWCGPGIGYNVYFRLKKDKDEEWERDENWQKATVHQNIGLYVHTVGEDNYFLEYEVKVAAFNELGPGPNSSVEVIYSAEGMPIAVPDIQDTDNENYSAVICNWKPVPDSRELMRGRVLGYEIEYYSEKDPDHHQKTFVYGQVDSALIIGLEADTKYWVSMFVFNSAGNGPRTDWRLAETAHLSPTEYPHHVHVYSHGPKRVLVRWREISTKWNEETLSGYKLWFWKLNEDIRQAEEVIVGKVPEAILEGIHPDEIYTVRVLGFSTGGDGAKSEPAYFTLGGSVSIDPSTTEFLYMGFSQANNLKTSKMCILLFSVTLMSVIIIL